MSRKETNLFEVILCSPTFTNLLIVNKIQSFKIDSSSNVDKVEVLSFHFLVLWRHKPFLSFSLVSQLCWSCSHSVEQILSFLLIQSNSPMLERIAFQECWKQSFKQNRIRVFAKKRNHLRNLKKNLNQNFTLFQMELFHHQNYI